MTEPKPEMPEELEAFLGAARELEAPSPDQRARLASRLAASIAALPDGGGPEGGGAPEAKPASWLAAKVPAWAVAAAFVVGASAGALAPRGAPKNEAAVPVAPLPVASVAPVPVPVPVPVPEPRSARVDDLPAAPAARASTSAAAPAPSSSATGDLTRERALLDVARTALGRSDGPSAEQACAEHERAFPRGALAEEREAIRVQALVVEGRAEDARARALRFQKTFPSSILVPAVLAAAGVSP